MKQEALLLLEYKPENATEQYDLQHKDEIIYGRAPWLKPYRFKKGQSGNPTGNPPGYKSLKTYAKEYFQTLDDEAKKHFISFLPPDFLWKMAEGNPDSKNSTDLMSDGKPIVFQVNLNVNKFSMIEKQDEKIDS